jgi:site-specific DNA recombinase
VPTDNDASIVMLMRPAPRIVVYGRHSTAMQTASSSADQAASCSKLVEFLGGTVVATYLDPEQSGYRRDRAGLKRLLADVKAGVVDVIACEALDRLARDAEDVAWLGKKLAFHRVQLHTVSEGHVDEIKLAVAGLLGAMFIKQLVDKTLRGMAAAVLAGRFAGGRAYGYKRLIKLDARGELIRGILEVNEAQAIVVKRIYSEFAAGRSAIQIATRLNKDGIPGPRSDQWNASSIRGDPQKLVGILNNPLYEGRLVWGRRQWRRNPDSERRERLSRLRDPSEWVEIDVPDLRIVSPKQWEAVRSEMSRRQRQPNAISPAGKPRAKHLLSGLIRCSCCGANYTISGKDYYRCAGQKERGTCTNTVSVRQEPIETATLAVLQSHLLTEEHAQIFVDEFRREAVRLASLDQQADEAGEARRRLLEMELSNLTQNLLGGLVSSTLMAMISQREAELSLLSMPARAPSQPKTAQMPPHPVLLQRFDQKIASLRTSLNDASIRSEAAEILSTLIESVTIYPDGRDGPEAEVVAKVADLLAFATNDNAAREGGDRSSMAVVAGTGFEPVTFRL